MFELQIFEEEQEISMFLTRFVTSPSQFLIINIIQVIIRNRWSESDIPLNLIQKNIGLLDKAAQLISLFTAAPVVSIPVFIYINYEMSETSFLVLTGICLLFAGILPLLFIVFWSQKIRKTAIDLPDKEDRPIFLIFIILSYFVGTIVLYFLNAPWLVTGLMFCYLTNTLVILIINFFWKISIHSMGVAAPAAALLLINGVAGVVLGCLLLAVMWSRLHLHRHSIAQVLAGACLGFFFTGFQLFLINIIVQ